VNNNIGGDGKDVYIANGGIAKLTSDAGTNTLLNLWYGGLNMTNEGATAKISVNSQTPIDVGQGGDFTLNLREGILQSVGSSVANEPAFRLGYRNDGFTATANIGGSDDPALLLTQLREVYVGDTDLALVAGTNTARLNLLANGSMIVSNNNIRVGHAGADGKVTIDGGSLTMANSNPATVNYLYVSSADGKGELVINSGVINTPNASQIQVGTAVTGSGILRANAGMIYTSRIGAGGITWTNTLYLNGSQIYNNPGQNNGDFIGQFKYAYIQAGGAKISIPTNTAPTATQRFEHDPALGGTADGGLTLSGGGILTLTSSTNTFTGPITISEGTTLHLTHVDAFTTGGVPSITLNNSAIGWKKASGFASLLAKLTPDSTGAIVLYPENATESINLTGFPGVSVRFQGTFTYTGTITLDSGATALTFAPENNAVITYSPVISSLPLIVNGVGNGMVNLTGDNNAWTNSITVNGGRLSASHTNALGNGTGPISIYNGAALRINAAVAATFVSRITTDSKGYIILTANAAAVNIDLTNLPGVYLGTDEVTLNYTGTIIPASDKVFRLGGGNASALGNNGNAGIFVNLTNGTDTVINNGLVSITNSTGTGSTIITNNGGLRVSSEASLGVVPSGLDVDNIVLDSGGAIRLTDANVILNVNANRGVEVRSGGGQFRTWGAKTINIQGPLSGTGGIIFTDGGTTQFSGTNNTYSGTMDIQTGSTLIGNGTTFSWNKNAKVTGVNGAGSRLGVNANANLTWTTDMGNPLGSADATRKSFGFRKLGSGTLTVDCAQQYLNNTDLEGGTLKVAAAGAVPSGAGIGDVNFSNNAKLDVNGNNITLNALNNSAGSVIDSASTKATQITLGANNNNWTLAAPITNSLAVIKTGTGTMTLAIPQTSIGNAMRVDSGTVVVPPSLSLDGSVNLNGAGTTLSLVRGSFLGTNGLTAYYYYGVSGVAQIATYAVMQNRLATSTPNVITTSLVAGDTCDYGTNKLYNGDTYVLIHHGRFMAETSGTYAFALSSDDGSTLCIDGNLLVDNNKDQSWTAIPQKTNTVYLAAGLHEVMMGMYENTGGQGLTLFYQTPSQSVLTPVPNNLLSQDVMRITNLSGTGKMEAVATTNVTPLELVANTASTFSGSVVATQGIYIVKNGTAKQSMAATNYPASTLWEVRSGELEFTMQPNRGEIMVQSGATASLAAPSSIGGLPGKYYTACTAYGNFTDLVMFKNYIAGYTPTYTFATTYNGKTVLDFGTTGTGFPPPYNTGSPIFQAFWEGYINIPETGTYTFYTSSDDGSMVFIDGQAIVNNWGGHGVQERTGSISLTAGLHGFALNFYNSSGGYGLTASISGPSLTKQFIPNSMLVNLSSPTEGKVNGISGAGTYALNNAAAHEVLNDGTNRTFAGSLSGSVRTVLSKTGPATWTLTGNNSAFAGTLNVVTGRVAFAGTASLGGALLNNGEVQFDVTADRTFNMSAGGKGTLVKNENSTVTLKLSGTNFEQQLTVNAGRVLFDNQGNNIIMTRQPIVKGTGSWGIVGVGNTTLYGGTNASSTVSGKLEVNTGKLTLIGNPVVDGLVVKLDASVTNSIYADANGAITNWTSLVGNMTFSQAVSSNCPTYNPNAFNGRGAVVFGTNYQGLVTSTHLESSTSTTNKTIFIVTRMTGAQTTDWPGVWGQTGQDKGIRASSSTTQWIIPGDGNDFCNGAGGSAFVNGVLKTANTEVGTIGHILTQFAGANAVWASSMMTSIGHYLFSSPLRYYKGEIAEMLVYNRAVTDAERIAIQNYLNAKWLVDRGAPVTASVLPSGVSLEMVNNGTLDLAGNTQTFASITGSGSITNGNAIVTDELHPGGDGVIGTLRFAGFEQQTVTYYADLSQNMGAPCDVVVISGTGSISLDGLIINVNLLAVPGTITRFKVMSTLGTFTGAPVLTGTTTYWKAVVGDSNQSLYLMYASGTLISFR
jgi:autotransporter-associated beta strand protein